MATGERVCYFYSFVFAIRKVFNLDIPIILDNPFGLLDPYLRDAVESFLKAQQYQQILLICDKKGISVTDWIQLQIAYSTEREALKKILTKKLNSLRRRLRFEENPEMVQNLIKDLIAEVEYTL